ncbi:Na-translocating system protein MpsC family protein [Paenibacillus dendrobii]|nr:Na-translocating system protein MpsC family protein [Paenibacillus dendrobii]
MDQLHNQSFQQIIASYTGKLLRDHFGKGPESVVVSTGSTFITIYLRNFMTPTEKILLEQHQEGLVMETRDKLMLAVMPEILQYLQDMSSVSMEECYYDWDLEQKTGMIMIISREPVCHAHFISTEYNCRKEIEAELNRISAHVQKAPCTTDSYEMNPRTLLVVRNGVLLPMEQEMIRLGQGDTLKRVKRKLEKEYVLKSHILEELLPTRISDCFIDWNYTLDKSILVLALNPHR